MGRSQGTRPSMQQVAERAGVSKTTVSLVLSDAPGTRITDATRARVRAAAEDLGYRRNLVASGLRRPRTDTIGLIADRIATEPHGWAMLVGAQEAAWRRGRMLFIANTSGDPAHEREAVEALLDRQVDGIVLGAVHHRRIVVPEVPAAVPLVLLDGFDPDARRAGVVPADEQGGYEATRILLEAGHGAIGFVTTSFDVPAASLRLAGHRRALAEYGVAFDHARVVIARDRHAGTVASAGEEAVRGLLEHGAPCTALFCFNDRIASGAYRAVRAAGRRVPADVSIVGFDDQADLALGLDPPLTTVALPHEAMGRWAVDRVLDQIEGVAGADAPELHEERCAPVLRASVGPPPTPGQG